MYACLPGRISKDTYKYAIPGDASSEHEDILFACAYFLNFEYLVCVAFEKQANKTKPD